MKTHLGQLKVIITVVLLFGISQVNSGNIDTKSSIAGNTITKSSSCLVPRTDDTDSPLGINDQMLTNSSLKIYPNPAKDNINIEITGNKSNIISYEIFDITGNLIKSENINIYNTPVNIDTYELQEGTYIISLISNDIKISRKIIIAHK